MHMMPLALQQALALNAFEKAKRRPMVENCRGFGRCQADVYRNGMALIGPDPVVFGIEHEPLLVAGFNKAEEFIARQGLSELLEGIEKPRHRSPAGFIQRYADQVGFVPQDETEKLAFFLVGVGDEEIPGDNGSERLSSGSLPHGGAAALHQFAIAEIPIREALWSPGDVGESHLSNSGPKRSSTLLMSKHCSDDY